MSECKGADCMNAEMVKALEDLKKSFHRVNRLWDGLDNQDAMKGNIKSYPFDHSFDELSALVDGWADEFIAGLTEVIEEPANFEDKALRYAERYGIIEYYVKGSNMVYYESYPTEGKFKHTINLKDMSHSSKRVKFIRKPYVVKD